jgi:hypothetical protein
MVVEEPPPLSLLEGTKALLPTSSDFEAYLLVFLKASISCSVGGFIARLARLTASVVENVYYIF